jgi:hypothetical protein
MGFSLIVKKQSRNLENILWSVLANPNEGNVQILAKHVPNFA